MDENRSVSRERERERELPLTLIKLKEAYKNWLVLFRNFPKIERFGIGQKIERSFLDALELIFLASFLSPAQKLPLLIKAIARLDVLKFFLQIVWENKLLTTDQYATLLATIEAIGKMLYAWKQGIEKKTQQ
jgi:hypothetical protein